MLKIWLRVSSQNYLFILLSTFPRLPVFLTIFINQVPRSVDACLLWAYKTATGMWWYFFGNFVTTHFLTRDDLVRKKPQFRPCHLRCSDHAQPKHAQVSNFYNHFTREQPTYQFHRIIAGSDRTTELSFPSTALWYPTNLYKSW